MRIKCSFEINGNKGNCSFELSDKQTELFKRMSRERKEEQIRKAIAENIDLGVIEYED